MTHDVVKAGDKLYRVYDGFDGYEIEEVTVKKVTATKAWFTRSGGLSWGCRTGIEVDAAQRCARTPDAAVQQFIASARGHLAKAKGEFERACAWAEQITRNSKALEITK